MRSKVASQLRKEFAARLKQALPQFHELAGANVPPGCRVYGWEIAPDLACYLVLLVAPQLDWFTLEVAWSRRGRLPANAPPGRPRPELQGEDLRFRIHYLWGTPGQDFWWKLYPELSGPAEIERTLVSGPPAAEDLARIPPLVDDAMRRIADYVMPYFREVAEARGYSTER